MIDIAKMPVQDHRKVINNPDAPVKVAQQPLFEGPSSTRTVVQKKDVDVKSTTSKISEATKTISVKKPAAKPEVKKREIKKNGKKNSSNSSTPDDDDSSALSEISDFEESKVVLKGSSTRGKIVEVNPKKKQVEVTKKKIVDEDEDMSSEEEVIKKHVPSRRRGVSEPATTEPVKEIGKRKRVVEDESENEYDPEPKRAKNDDKEEKDHGKQQQKEEVK